MVLGWRLFKQRRKHLPRSTRRRGVTPVSTSRSRTHAHARTRTHDRKRNKSINESNEINPRLPTRQSIGRVRRDAFVHPRASLPHATTKTSTTHANSYDDAARRRRRPRCVDAATRARRLRRNPRHSRVFWRWGLGLGSARWPVRLNVVIKGPRGFRGVDPRSVFVGRARRHFVAPYARVGAILTRTRTTPPTPPKRHCRHKKKFASTKKCTNALRVNL